MDLPTCASFAVELARRTGREVAAARAGAGLAISHKRGVELLTSADLAADRMICDEIRRAYPEHLILSEESAPELEPRAGGSGSLWIVDPIDGTVNYAYGQPQVAVSIAFADRGAVPVGVVEAPFQGETFVAIRGGGARLNGELIRPSECTELHRALIATGFPYEPHRREELLPRLRRVLLHCRDIRRAGSAALDLCWVAAGRLDGYYETLSPWDIAAGRLILTEAGGRVTNMQPGEAISPELDGRELVATAPGIHAALVQLLADGVHGHRPPGSMAQRGETR
jgi:myo-inositol-1(or 4)-monophosphatase